LPRHVAAQKEDFGEALPPRTPHRVSPVNMTMTSIDKR
jgi:hypothetical protein